MAEHSQLLPITGSDMTLLACAMLWRAGPSWCHATIPAPSCQNPGKSPASMSQGGEIGTCCRPVAAVVTCVLQTSLNAVDVTPCRQTWMVVLPAATAQ